MEFGIRRQEFHSGPDKNKSNKELVENTKGRFSILAHIMPQLTFIYKCLVLLHNLHSFLNKIVTLRSLFSCAQL